MSVGRQGELVRRAVESTGGREAVVNERVTVRLAVYHDRGQLFGGFLFVDVSQVVDQVRLSPIELLVHLRALQKIHARFTFTESTSVIHGPFFGRGRKKGIKTGGGRREK